MFHETRRRGGARPTYAVSGRLALGEILAFAVLAVGCSDSTTGPEDGNSSPVLVPISDMTIMAGQTDSVTITATDGDGDALTFSISDNPGFLSITDVAQTGNAATATLVVAPGAGVHGSFDPTIRVSDGAGATDEQGCHIEVPAVTALFLRQDDALSAEQTPSGVTKVFAYGTGATFEWRALLNQALSGNTYGFTLWLGAGTGAGQTGSFDVALIANRGGVTTELAQTTLSVPYNQNFVRYTATVTGQSGTMTAIGDKLTLRLTVTGVSKAGVMFGSGDADSHVLVPGVVTVGAALPDVDRVEVTPAALATYPGESVQLTATTLDADGDPITGPSVEWSSSDPSVATVGAGGVVDAVAEGTTVITATSEGMSGTANITVLAAPVADWSLAEEWVTFQGNAGHTGYVNATLDPRTFEELWVTTVRDGSSLSPVTVGDGNVYVSTSGSYGDTKILTALDAQDGVVLWDHDFGDINSVHPPATGDGAAYVTTGGHSDSFLWAFDATDGTVLFNSSYGNQWSSYYAPVVIGGTVYMAGGYYGGMYAFDATTGDELWFYDTNQYDEWSPAVRDGLVYAYTGNYDPKVEAVDATTGELVYEIADPNFDWSGWSMGMAPALGGSNDLLAIQDAGFDDGRLISFDLDGQTIGWELTGEYDGNVTVANGVLYVINGDEIEARSESDGALLWSWDPPSGSPQHTLIATDNLLFVSTSSDTYAMDLSSGYPVWSYPMSGPLALSNQGILFIAGYEDLVAIDVR